MKRCEEKVGVRLPRELAQRLKRVCAVEMKTVSVVAREAILEYLNQKERPRKAAA